MKTITPIELQMLIDQGDVELIDVRPKRDFEKVHALVARSIPLSEFKPHSVLAYRKLDQHAPMYIMCRRNTLATLAACGLAGAGLNEAIIVEGGLEAWEGQCLPVVRGKCWRMPIVDAPSGLLAGLAAALSLTSIGFLFFVALTLFAALIVRRTLRFGADANTRQTIRPIEFGRCFARMGPVVTIAAIAALLACFGGNVLQAGHSVEPSRPVSPLSKPEKPRHASGEIERGPRGKSEIALTFDAGANAECFEDLIATLENAGVHSTFFITGNFAQRNSECAKAITKHGHEIGNHTWNHLDLTRQSEEVVREEITRAEDLLKEFQGKLRGLAGALPSAPATRGFYGSQPILDIDPFIGRSTVSIQSSRARHRSF